MDNSPEEMFLAKLEKAPPEAREFFANIKHHFEKKNDVKVHNTKTDGGDLRLAIPSQLLGRKRHRNFATLTWKISKRVVFARTYLTPDELSKFRIGMGTVPRSEKEPLKSDIILSAAQAHADLADFVKALEAAHTKLYNQLVPH